MRVAVVQVAYGDDESGRSAREDFAHAYSGFGRVAAELPVSDAAPVDDRSPAEPPRRRR